MHNVKLPFKGLNCCRNALKYTHSLLEKLKNLGATLFAHVNALRNAKLTANISSR